MPINTLLDRCLAACERGLAMCDGDQPPCHVCKCTHVGHSIFCSWGQCHCAICDPDDHWQTRATLTAVNAFRPMLEDYQRRLRLLRIKHERMRLAGHSENSSTDEIIHELQDIAAVLRRAGLLEGEDG